MPPAFERSLPTKIPRDFSLNSKIIEGPQPVCELQRPEFVGVKYSDRDNVFCSEIRHARQGIAEIQAALSRKASGVANTTHERRCGASRSKRLRSRFLGPSSCGC